MVGSSTGAANGIVEEVISFGSPNQPYYSAGARNSGGTAAISGASGTANTGSGGVTVNFANGTFTGSSVSSKPLYFAVQYVMRVK